MQPQGRYIPLSLPRRWILDLLHFAKQMPSIPVERRMSLAPLVKAHVLANKKISWCAVFMKAYAMVIQRFPELRRSFLTWPWGRIYEHAGIVASVAIEREYRGEKAVFFAHLRGPQNQSLCQIDEHLRRFKTVPVEEIGLFRRALKVSRWPGPIRRFLWWISLNGSGPIRERRLGTFGVSVYASLGASSLHPLSPLTTTLNYGPFDAEGNIDVRLTYDHRVLDGAMIARALSMLEDVLCGSILEEVVALHDVEGLSPAEAPPLGPIKIHVPLRVGTASDF